MKANLLITMAATLVVSGATLGRGQDAVSPAQPEPLAPDEVAAQADAQAQRKVAQAQEQMEQAKRQAEKQMAEARRNVSLARAGADSLEPRPPGAGAEVAGVKQRLRGIIDRGGGEAGRTLVIRSSETDPKTVGNLEEDLAVMSHIFDKSVSQQLDEDHRPRAMGIDVLFGPGFSPIRSLYLEGYGVLFTMNVSFPLLPPPEKPEEAKEKPPADSTWEEAKRELHGQQPGLGDVIDSAIRFESADGPREEYDAEKVRKLQDALLDALKNATNIRNLRSDDSVTVCVFGGGVGARHWVKAKGNKGVHDVNAVGWSSPENTSGTIMALRVKKTDVDAFAKEKFDLDAFRKKVTITTYAGDSGGWGGNARNFFYGGGGFGGGGFRQ